MAETASTMLQLGTEMPAFELPDYDGRTIKSADYEGKPVLVVFMCNHCPFVKHIASVLGRRAIEFERMNVGVVGINANDTSSHPEDAPDKMKEFAAQNGLRFPYLVDESQEVAKAYRAACTPDFFLFDAGHQLVYRGQFDDSRPSNGKPVTGDDLAAAVEAVVSRKPVPEKQTPSIGCNIKWKQGNEPDYFG